MNNRRFAGCGIGLAIGSVTYRLFTTLLAIFALLLLPRLSAISNVININTKVVRFGQNQILRLLRDTQEEL